MKILIGGDTVPTQSNFKLFADGDVEALIGKELKDKFASADFITLNLEVPLTDKWSPIDKSGINLIAPSTSINGLKKINPFFYGLANNHILDQDVQGLESTVSLLKDHGIAYAGVGDNLHEAAKPYIFEKNGIKVGIYCCAEHEFSTAKRNVPGANPFDIIESFYHIAELKKNCDYVIVLYHGGKERYRYPSPFLQKICHEMVNKGANLIICQHSHCIGCEEKYQGGTIVYGQGNFLFDLDGNENEFWLTGLLVELEVDVGTSSIRYFPLVRFENGVRLADTSKSNEVIGKFTERSEQIKQPGFIETEYKNLASKNLNGYLGTCIGKISFLSRVINYLSGGVFIDRFIKSKYGKQQILAILNHIECEAHRELMLQGLKNSCGK